MKYYSTERPIDLGTYPRGEIVAIMNYGFRKYVKEIDRDAWGYIEYAEPLTEKQKNDYELVEGGK